MKISEDNRAKLYIGTMFFPYGKGEKNVIIQELQHLTRKFQVVLVSSATDEIVNDKENETVLEDISIIRIDYTKIKHKCLKSILLLGNSTFQHEVKEIFSGKKNVVERIYQSTMFFLYAQNFCTQFEQILNKNEKAIFYSFWNNVQTMGIVLLKQRCSSIKLVSRIHGFDLYNERYPGGRQPYKKWMDGFVDKLFFICETGGQYYVKNFVNRYDKNRYCVIPLGTNDDGALGPNNCTETFEIVSCSSVISLKRVDLIIKAIADLPERYNIKWIHFGDGVEKNRVEQLAREIFDKKKNVQYKFMGYVNNTEIVQYYKENSVDLFISTSQTEGLPISMQEAMAHGIPIVSTDVGGVHELINQNGFLISANPMVKEITCVIEKIIEMNYDERLQLRNRSLEIWKEKYNANVNGEKLACELEKMI